MTPLEERQMEHPRIHTFTTRRRMASPLPFTPADEGNLLSRGGHWKKVPSKFTSVREADVNFADRQTHQNITCTLATHVFLSLLRRPTSMELFMGIPLLEIFLLHFALGLPRPHVSCLASCCQLLFPITTAAVTIPSAAPAWHSLAGAHDPCPSPHTFFRGWPDTNGKPRIMIGSDCCCCCCPFTLYSLVSCDVTFSRRELT